MNRNPNGIKKRLTALSLVFIFFLMVGASCDKPNNYPKNSVLGPWRCTEESSYHNFRKYNVSIELQGYDSTEIIILNLYNLGYDVETYATIKDTVITIQHTNQMMHDIAGIGHIKRDFSAIVWQFSYMGNHADPVVDALFTRP